MYWDRFDICEAYFVAGMLHHSGQFSKGYAILSRLVAMDFRPSPLLICPDNLEDNAREIYDNIDKATL